MRGIPGSDGAVSAIVRPATEPAADSATDPDPAARHVHRAGRRVDRRRCVGRHHWRRLPGWRRCHARGRCGEIGLGAGQHDDSLLDGGPRPREPWTWPSRTRVASSAGWLAGTPSHHLSPSTSTASRSPMPARTTRRRWASPSAATYWSTLSCGGTPLSLSVPVQVRGGEFLVADEGGVIVSGRVVSRVNAVGTINAPGCVSTTWWAERSGAVPGPGVR